MSSTRGTNHQQKDDKSCPMGGYKDTFDVDDNSSSDMDDISTVLAHQTESSLNISATKEISKVNQFVFAMPRQTHPGLYSIQESTTTNINSSTVTHTSTNQTTTTTTSTTGVPGFPDFPDCWKNFTAMETLVTCSSPVKKSSIGSTTTNDNFHEIITPIRSNVAVTHVGVGSNTALQIPSSSLASSPYKPSPACNPTSDYNGLLLDLNRSNTKEAHKHNLRRLKKLRRERVNHGSLRAACIVQSMQRSQNQNLPTTTGKNDAKMDSQEHIKEVAVKNKHSKRQSNKLWTKIQRRRTRRAATKSLAVYEWKRVVNEKRSENCRNEVDNNNNNVQQPSSTSSEKKKQKRLLRKAKRKIKRDVMDLSLNLNELHV